MKERIEPVFGEKKDEPSLDNNSPISNEKIEEFERKMSMRNQQRLPIGRGVYCISAFLFVNFVMLLGHYNNVMWEAGRGTYVRYIDATGSWVSFFQLAILIKLLIAVVFLVLAIRRVKNFRIVSSLFLTITSVVPGIFLILAASINAQLFILSNPIGKTVVPLIFALLISLYLIRRKKVRTVFG